MRRLKSRPEILAPAGSVESLKAAVAAGADAVYIGGSKFGARAYADNPEQDILLSAIDYVHTKDRRIYLTVNTLMKEQELTKELYAFIENYYKAGIDAVIVQDVGVLHFLAVHFPELPVHASTQMTLVSADGVKWLSGYPITRLVPARELSLEEIRELREKTDLEIECFVHGALCYCYSGQCLFSSMIGGRSGNRGRCAQPCRMPYTVLADGSQRAEGLHVLSPKDLCTLDLLPELIGAGIDSFKIEGRMKRPEYAAGVTAAYRLLTDIYMQYGEEEFIRYLKQHPDILKEQTERAADLYNRGGFTGGYYMQYHGRQMMSMERPNHSGVKVGTVEGVQGIRAAIRLEKELYPQDVLEIRTDEGEAYEFTVGKAGLEEKQGFYATNVKKGFPLAKGQEVFRTKNEKLLKDLQKEYMMSLVQLPVTGEFTAGVGEPVSLTVTAQVHAKSSLKPGADRESSSAVSVCVTGDIVMEAENRPVTEEQVREQLSKTGESEFYFENLTAAMHGKCFLPMGKIKELRRTAFEQLREKLLLRYRREPAVPSNKYTAKTVQTVKKTPAGLCPEAITLVSTREQLACVLENEQVTTVYVDFQNEPVSDQIKAAEEAKLAGKRAFLVLPHIFRSRERRRYEEAEELFWRAGFDGFLAKSFEELTYLKESGFTARFEIRLNYNLYAFQSEAKKFFWEAGFSRFTAPIELNEEELKEYDVSDSDFLVYGRIPLMVSVQCIWDNIEGYYPGRMGTLRSAPLQRICNVPACSKEGGELLLSDRMGAKFPVRRICTSCCNVIYNSACFSLLGMELSKSFSPAGWRLDFTFETKEETARVLHAFFEGKALEAEKNTLTKGHFRRGIE